MENIDEIEESFKADNPFLGVWKPVDGSDLVITFDSEYWVRIYNGTDNYNSNKNNYYQQFRYTYNKEKLIIHDILMYETNHEGDGIFQIPFNSSMRTFVFIDKEIKKVELLS